MTWQIHQGDALEVLKTMEDGSVNCCVTSPPYWRQRDYEVDGQIGIEDTIEEYLSRLVSVFREVHKVLRRDGTLWINMGDGYVSYARPNRPGGLRAKNLIGMPWLLAFALQADGWILRSDIIWHKPNPILESVTDRCTKSHEYIFLLSKRRKYYFDIDAVKEPVVSKEYDIMRSGRDSVRAFNRKRETSVGSSQGKYSVDDTTIIRSRNPRTVWKIPTQPRTEDHNASFPDELARRCILAGCPPGGTVLDPFVGRGTTVIVALRNQRNGIGIDLSPEYCEMARRNIIDDAPLLNTNGVKK